MPRISYNDILASFTCENYRCIPWFRGSCRRGKGIPETNAGHDIPAGTTPEGESICTGSCDARILAHAQMFVQAENRTYFRHYRHKRNTRRPCAISRHSPEAEAREHATAKRPPFSRICKRPHRLRNSDAALVVAGPHKPVKRLRGTCRQAGAQIPNGSDYRHSAQITSPGLGASMPGPLGNM